MGKKKVVARSTEEEKKEKRSRLPDALNDDTLLSRDQASKLLGVSTKTIINREKSGELPSVKNGNTVRILYRDLKNLYPEKLSAQKSSLPVEVLEILKREEEKAVDYFNRLLKSDEDISEKDIKKNFERFNRDLLMRYLTKREEFALLKQLFLNEDGE